MVRLKGLDIFSANKLACMCFVLAEHAVPLTSPEVTVALRDAGLIRGWRDELYPITEDFHEPPLALIERAAAPYFGIKASLRMPVHISQDRTFPAGITDDIAQDPRHPKCATLCGPSAGLRCPYQWVCGKRRGALVVGSPPQRNQAHVAWIA